MKIAEWIHDVIDNLHVFERCELAEPRIDRDEAVGDWIIRCLANPDCEGSDYVLQKIAERREFVALKDQAT